MRLLLLALPPLLLAACAEPCTAPALTVAWRFELADGTHDATCLDAGVETVGVWVDGNLLGDGMACSQGTATFSGLAVGSHAFTIQGRSKAGGLRYQDWGTLEVASCGESRVTLKPGAGVLRLDYSTSTGVCYATDPGQVPSYIWYWLKDTTTGLIVSWVDASQVPTLLPCQTGAQAEINIPLPWGLYSLSFIQDVLSVPPVPPATATTYQALYQMCTPTSPPLTLHAQGVTPLPVTMALTTGACSP